MHSKIILLLTIWAVAAMAAPVDDMTQTDDVPDLDAQNQFFYTYGYGYPHYAFPAAYHVPVTAVAAASASNVPAATTKITSQPSAITYTYPSYAYPGFPYPYGPGYSYRYGFPYTI